MKKIKKISSGEQIQNFYLLGVYFLYKAKRHRSFMEENSAVFDHLNNLYLRCLFLGLSGEYLLKALFVKKGFSIKANKNAKSNKINNFQLKKPAEGIDENDYVVGYGELIESLSFLTGNTKFLNGIKPKLKKLKKWRNGAVHSFHLEKLREKELKKVYEILEGIEEEVNSDLKLSTSIYIQVYLDYRETTGGIRINRVKLTDNITCREIDARQSMFDVESYFGNIHTVEWQNSRFNKNIEEHVTKQLRTYGYIFKNRNIDVEVDDEIVEI